MIWQENKWKVTRQSFDCRNTAGKIRLHTCRCKTVNTTVHNWKCTSTKVEMCLRLAMEWSDSFFSVFSFKPCHKCFFLPGFKLDSGKTTFDIGDMGPVITVLHVKGKCVIRPNIRLTHFPILILRAIYRERREGKIAAIHQKSGHRQQKRILGYFHISNCATYKQKCPLRCKQGRLGWLLWHCAIGLQENTKSVLRKVIIYIFFKHISLPGKISTLSVKWKTPSKMDVAPRGYKWGDWDWMDISGWGEVKSILRC